MLLTWNKVTTVAAHSDDTTKTIPQLFPNLGNPQSFQATGNTAQGYNDKKKSYKTFFTSVVTTTHYDARTNDNVG